MVMRRVGVKVPVSFFNYLGEAGVTVLQYMETMIDRMNAQGRIRTGETYYATLRSFMTFRRGVDMPLSALTAEEIERYEGYLRRRGVVRNTSSFYMRVLRTAYNCAVAEGVVTLSSPVSSMFKNVYTGIDKTVKRAISLDYMKRIKGLDLHGNKRLEFARDMFMFSFYMRGMSFVDMAFLRRCNLGGGVIWYTRRKTGQRLKILCEEPMYQIIERYRRSCVEDYLLPIINCEGGDVMTIYRNRLKVVNRQLKYIADMVGLDIPLTHYVARHSWATIARYMNIPISVISEGMGHDSIATTQIYLAQLDTSLIDQANHDILSKF